VLPLLCPGRVCAAAAGGRVAEGEVCNLCVDATVPGGRVAEGEEYNLCVDARAAGAG
jgi:hypothetical protein